MITAHHASGASDDLRKKWLRDPSAVRPRKSSKPTTPAGDVVKTMNIVAAERKRTPVLHVTLAFWNRYLKTNFSLSGCIE
jgi:hypothetical protein